MKKTFDKIQHLQPFSKKDVKGRLNPENKNVFSALVDLRNKNIFPTLYLDFLEKTDPQNSKELAQKFLDIAIFANSNMSTENIHEWFLNGQIPRTYFYGIQSMSSLRQDIERLNTLEKNQDNVVQRINKIEEKQSEKGSKSLSDRMQKARNQYNELDELILKAQENVMNTIYQIESKLATGRKI